MASYNLNEILKSRRIRHVDSEETVLSNSSRVKVLSPMRQVMNRFARNRLAVFGIMTLVFMFVVCFIGPLFYAYGQSESIGGYVIKKNDAYASATSRTKDFSSVLIDETVTADPVVLVRVNTDIENVMESEKKGVAFYADDGHAYLLLRDNANIFRLFQNLGKPIAKFGSGPVKVGTYDSMRRDIEYEHDPLDSDFLSLVMENCIAGAEGSFEYQGVVYTFHPGDLVKQYELYAESENAFLYSEDPIGEGFETAASATAAGDCFDYDGMTYYVVASGEENYEVYSVERSVLFRVYSNFSFDTYVTALPLTQEFKANALRAIVGDGTFEASAILDTDSYQSRIARNSNNTASNSDASASEENEDSSESSTETSESQLYQNVRFTIAASPEDPEVYVVKTASGTPYAELHTLVVRRKNGDDTMDLDLKNAIREKIQEIRAKGISDGEIEFYLPLQSENGAIVYEDGKIKYNSEPSIIKIQTDTAPISGEYSYKILADQTTFSRMASASPSSDHILGTDKNGYDVFARLMYGGRISLLVGFVVVILQCLIGVILGGLAGYYGGWVDSLVMRAVDVFYCLPYLPIMIVVNTLLNANDFENSTKRIFIMMVAMGFLGWARIARLVRGQILSLREQEFMVAAEATGLPVFKRIFRHLIPNVMPQLVVAATLGLGEAILLESTLSFLGMGVKFPAATWGNMITSADLSNFENTANIWIPVGLAISLTVIAFNFVGDGLRDAFDPKAKK